MSPFLVPDLLISVLIVTVLVFVASVLVSVIVKVPSAVIFDALSTVISPFVLSNVILDFVPPSIVVPMISVSPLNDNIPPSAPDELALPSTRVNVEVLTVFINPFFSANNSNLPF